MTLKNSIQSHLDQLAQALDIGNIALSTEGECAITFNGLTILFQLEESANAVQLIAPLCELADGDYQDFTTMLLQANMSWDDTHGCSLGLDGDAETVVLSKWIRPENLDFPEFQNAVEHFVSLALCWRQALPEMYSSSISFKSSSTATCPAEPFMLV